VLAERLHHNDTVQEIGAIVQGAGRGPSGVTVSKRTSLPRDRPSGFEEQ
jgi:hypothetical protein